LVIILDAPADVLYARKQEVPIEYLESNRKALAKKRCYAKRVVTVDTNKPFNEVLEIVNNLIWEYCADSGGIQPPISLQSGPPVPEQTEPVIPL
jgi:hypothetical protein